MDRMGVFIITSPNTPYNTDRANQENGQRLFQRVPLRVGCSKEKQIGKLKKMGERNHTLSLNLLCLATEIRERGYTLKVGKVPICHIFSQGNYLGISHYRVLISLQTVNSGRG